MDTENLGIGSRIEHDGLGRGVIVEVGTEFYKIWFKSSNTTKSISKSFPMRVISAMEGGEASGEVASMADLEMVINNILDQRADLNERVELGGKWDGGTLILKPGSEDLQTKEMSIDSFFHKIVMVRDRLRVLEQNINSHKVLTDEDKVHMQQYITRAYGSLTTFNVLFKNSHEQFKGSSSKG
jgi:hypothetical protein